MEDSIPELAGSSYRERVLRARKAPLSKKMGWGPDLYRDVLSRMKSGIRAQFPEADESEVESILRQRLNRLSKIEEHGLYHPVDSKNCS